MILPAWTVVLLLPGPASGQPADGSAPLSRAAMEAFLLKARIDPEHQATAGKYSWRASLDDGGWKHYAMIENEDGSTPSERNYRLNVAAYELDRALELNLLAPAVERTVNGRPTSVTWWLDNVAMDEVTRRKKKIEPPDPDRWHKQMLAVRLFDELIANVYRNVSPAFFLSSSWDNLLITRDWNIWLVDHTRTFQISRDLENPQSLTQADRTLLRRLRELTSQRFAPKLSRYLNSGQLDALEARRKLLVQYFDGQITRKGASAVLYDLPAR